MNQLYLLLCLFCFCTYGSAQTASKIKIHIDGKVIDSKNKSSIPYATVRLLNPSDSTYIQGNITDTKGEFNLSTSSFTKLIIEVSYIGYKSSYKLITAEAEKSSISLGDILLEENAFELKEAVIEAKTPDILVKGDTIEYNAGAYTSQVNDVLQDIVKKIPGIEIDDSGNITANGKPVKKILVDGKEFFDNDIAMALSNLPANMIKKLQLFKEESEKAKITGFKDINPDQVLNVVVKDELKQSIFGNGRAGYGSNDKYEIKGMSNYMRNDNQLSMVVDLSNVNTSEYGMNNEGIDKNKNIGINFYNQSTQKFKIGGNIRYTNNDNLIESKSNTQTFLSSGDRFSEQNSTSQNKREGMNTGLNISWLPDSLTTIYFRSYISLNRIHNNQHSDQLSYVVEKDTTDGYSVNRTTGDGLNINNNLTFGRKLNNKGRTISLELSQIYRKDNSKGKNYSETNYTGANPQKIIDQRIKTDSHSDNYSIGLTYVEPLEKDNSLQLSYSLESNTSKRIKDTRKKDENGDYTQIDSAYTRTTKNTFITQNIGLNFQSQKEKYNYMIGFTIMPYSSRSKVNLGDTIIEDLKQNVINYSPSFNFSYTPNTNTNLDINYSGSTSQPSAYQLSADTTIINALSKYYGNPDLKTSYSNNLSVFYQKSDFEKNRFLMLTGNFNYTFNSIENYTNIDDQGNSSSTYRNVDGNMGAGLGIIYNTPLRNKKLSINTNTYTNYYRNVGYMNAEKTVTNNIVLTEQFTFKFTATKIEAAINANITHNIAKNSLTNADERNTTTYGFTNNLLVKLPWDLSIQSNISYSRFAGYENDFKKSECLWNVSLAKLFMKDKKGSIKFQVFDLLNDRNNLNRLVTSNFVSDTRTNTVSRYFMLSFAYRFNIFKGGNDGQDNGYNDM